MVSLQYTVTTDSVRWYRLDWWGETEVWLMQQKKVWWVVGAGKWVHERAVDNRAVCT